MKSLGIGFGTLILGIIVSILLANTFTSAAPKIGSSYLGFIGFSILYLASVMAVCTYTIIKHKKYFREIFILLIQLTGQDSESEIHWDLSFSNSYMS